VLLFVRLDITSRTLGTYPSPRTIHYKFLANDSVEQLIFLLQYFELLVEKISSRIPLRNRYFTVIDSPTVRLIADRHRLTDYRNKHC